MNKAEKENLWLMANTIAFKEAQAKERSFHGIYDKFCALLYLVPLTVIGIFVEPLASALFANIFLLCIIYEARNKIKELEKEIDTAERALTHSHDLSLSEILSLKNTPLGEGQILDIIEKSNNAPLFKKYE